MLRLIRVLSALASAPSKGTCCGGSQDLTLVRDHFPKGHGALSLSAIRSCVSTFQRDLLRAVSGLSARAKGSSKATYFGECQDYPFVREHFPKGHVAVSLRNTLSREVIFQSDTLRCVLKHSACVSAPSKGTRYVESQDFPFAPAHLLK